MGIQVSPRAGLSFLCSSHRAENQTWDLMDALEQALLRLVWLEQKRLAQVLAAHGLTISQYLVLASIWQREDGCPMGELAGEMLQSSATMTGIVDRLVRLHLVQREPGASDRRVVVIGLTASGHDLMVRVQCDKRARLEHVLRGLPEDDRYAFLRLIEQYLEASATQY
jgi:DNA-binding MarR family transcriptional regulator